MALGTAHPWWPHPVHCCGAGMHTLGLVSITLGCSRLTVAGACLLQTLPPESLGMGAPKDTKAVTKYTSA